jgi:hypothetical protein
VVNIPAPGSFAYPVIEDNQDISRLLGLKKSDTRAEEFYHEGEEGARSSGIEGISSFLPSCSLVRLGG